MYRKPSFICIGAQKAGTSWLYNNLCKHPQAAMLPLKELHYFDEIEMGLKTNLYNRLVDGHWRNKWWRTNFWQYFYSSCATRNTTQLLWVLKYFLGKRSFEWYNSLFPDVAGKITGDFTPAYTILSENLVREIHRAFPHTKIILLLRDPVERDWSQYKMVLKRTGKTELLLDKSNAYFNEIILEKGARSNYLHALNAWSACYPAEQFFVGFYDSIQENPQQLFNNICHFLAIDNYNTESATEFVNKGMEKSADSDVMQILAEKYKDDLVALSNYFSKHPVNYPARWLQKYFGGNS